MFLSERQRLFRQTMIATTHNRVIIKPDTLNLKNGYRSFTIVIITEITFVTYVHVIPSLYCHSVVVDTENRIELCNREEQPFVTMVRSYQ